MKRALLIALALMAAGCEAEEVFGVRVPTTESAGQAAPGDLVAYFDCLREREATALSAHRGGPAPGFAENAIPTFENTLRIAPGAFLEVDVSQTADGVLVLMHDDRAERTTTGSGAIRELDMAQLLAFQLEDEDGRRVDARVPTLAEALEWADGKTVLELDVKRGVSYEDVAREVEVADAMDRVIFVTYSVDGASRLARVVPRAMIYTTIRNERDLDTLQQRGVDLSRVVAWLGDEEFSEDLIEALAARGVESRAGMFRRGVAFADASYTGLASVAVNDPAAAFAEIDRVDGADGFAALQCAQ